MDVLARETNVPVADGKAVWSWRPDAGVKSVKWSTRRRWQNSPVAGRSPGRARN